MASENQVITEELEDKGLWRDLLSYWFLGLCNNYGYNVMLSAAHDIITQFQSEHISYNDERSVTSARDCQHVSTGAILLADILPTLFFKLILPFLPYWMNFYIFLAVIFSAGGFLLVGFARTEWVAIMGIAFTSASGGIGEAKFMSYSSYYNKNVVSTWSSGTGAAGVIGSLSYATLRSFHISNRDTMLIMLIFPLLEAFSFWLLLRPKRNNLKPEVGGVYEPEEMPLENFREKLIYIKKLMKYMGPLVLVYLFEYFINQGLYELVYFEHTFLDRSSQYRWFTVDYQLGVFIARSSVNIVHFKKIWLMAVLQFINVNYFLLESIFCLTPTIWISFAIILWEGLLGGGAYVNTFYRISQEIPEQRRKFALAIVIQSDSIGITTAALLAIPAHNAICELAAVKRLTEW